MLSDIAEQNGKYAKSLDEWLVRRDELRAILWDILTAGYIEPPETVGCQIIASGQEAEYIIEENRRRYFNSLPEQRAAIKKLDCEYDSEATWTTQIIEYGGWAGEPPQRAILRIPDRPKDQPLPAVLIFHGHMPGCLIGKEEVSYLAEPLTARGFVTLCPDAIRWGDRRDKAYEQAEINDYKGMAFFSERNLAMPLLLNGQTLLGAMIWEHMRAVDLLCDMEAVDCGRIGCVGYSMGGMQSFWLAAMDERISCGVEGSGICSYSEWEKRQTLNALVNFIPHILRFTDSWEVGGLIAPRPFLCLDAEQDDFFPLEGIEQTIAGIRKTYEKYGQPDKFMNYIHSGGHSFIQQHFDFAIEWLERFLS